MPKPKLSKEERLQKQIDERNFINDSWNRIVNEQMVHKVYNGDSSTMNFLDENSIDLIVTSPPYYNAKEYSHWDDIDTYLSDMRSVFQECFYKLKSGRRLCLNISDIPIKGDYGVKWLPLGVYLIRLLEDIGFELSDRVFWFKTPIKGFNYGSLPFPPSPLICDSIEYIYIFRKPGKNNYSYLKKEMKDASKLTRDEYMEYTKQVWTIPRIRIKDNLEGHTAPFPLEIPYRCIKMYSFVNDIVLDPFAGSGTTALAAIDLKRNSVMSEINKEYTDLIISNIKKELSLNNIDKLKIIEDN